jgi:hypothetical protein
VVELADVSVPTRDQVVLSVTFFCCPAHLGDRCCQPVARDAARDRHIASVRHPDNGVADGERRDPAAGALSLTADLDPAVGAGAGDLAVEPGDAPRP